MVNFELEPAKQLASDIRSAHQAIDSALSDLANLTYSVIEVCRHSGATRPIRSPPIWLAGMQAANCPWRLR